MKNDTATNDLTFSVENLGSVRSGSFTPKPLTLFCGPNNSGKTWVMYALNHCYYGLSFLAQGSWKEERKPSLPAVEPLFAQNLQAFNDRCNSYLQNTVFNIPEEQLSNPRIYLESTLSLPKIIADWGVLSPFLMPAERNGLHLFFRELSARRAALLHQVSHKGIDMERLLRNVIRSPYAAPIAEYINWLNRLFEISNQHSADFHKLAEILEKTLAAGAYRMNPGTGSIVFKPHQTKQKDTTPELDLHATASSVKSLFGLWFYLRHQAKKGDVLMIDEPELSLHPRHQRAIARLLARLVNAGLRVVVSTHSDYIVREINTLLMLGESAAEDLQKKHAYDQAETLKTDQVAAYLFDEGTIKEFEVTPDDGIYASTFDEVIDDLNRVNNDIYYSLQERREQEND